MKPIQVTILGFLAGLVLGVGCASTAPPAGFHWIPQWGVYASPDDIF